MNFISWNTKQIINESTDQYFGEDIVEESISKTLKPVMNKMKKLNIFMDISTLIKNQRKQKNLNLKITISTLLMMVLLFLMIIKPHVKLMF